MDSFQTDQARDWQEREAEQDCLDRRHERADRYEPSGYFATGSPCCSANLTIRGAGWVCSECGVSIERVAYWLYWGERCLTSVLLPPGATVQEVIEVALREHDRNPTIGLDRDERPYERRRRLLNAQVFRFPRDGSRIEVL